MTEILIHRLHLKHLDDGILCVCEIRRDRIAEITYLLLPVQRNLETAVLHTSFVDIARRQRSHGRKSGLIGYEDVLAVLPEEVDISMEPVLEESGIDTDIDLGRCLPCHVRIAGGKFLDSLQPVSAGTEIGTTLLRILGSRSLIELPCAREIEETCTICAVVTHDTV